MTSGTSTARLGGYTVSRSLAQGGWLDHYACPVKNIETFPSYWEEHYDEISMDKDKFNVMFSSVLSNEGEVADNPMLRSVARILSKGVLES
jgi:hypothetical protein